MESPDPKSNLPAPGVPQLPFDRALLPTLSPVQVMHHAVANLARGGDLWTDHEQEAPPSFSRSIGGGKVTVSVSSLDGEFTRSALPLLWQVTKAVSWRTLIVAQALLAHWATLATSVDQAVVISIDRILDYRGLRPMHKKNEPDHWRHGHRMEERSEVARELRLLQNIIFSAVDIDGYPGKGKTRRKFNFFNSRFMVVTDTWGQLSIMGQGTTLYPTQIRFALGSWVQEYGDRGIRQLGKILDRNLSYDPYHESWELALASWLTLEVFPNNAGRERPIHRAVETVLEAIGQTVDQRHPKRTRVRLEKALDRMAADGYLSRWEYVGELETASAKAEFSTYLKTKVWLVPSAGFLEYYSQRNSRKLKERKVGALSQKGKVPV